MMEFRDLKAQYLRNKELIDRAVQNVLVNGCFFGGEPVSTLEKNYPIMWELNIVLPVPTELMHYSLL